MIFSPAVDGRVPIRRPPSDFLAAFQRRVAAGLLEGRPYSRSKYVVTEVGPDHLHVHAVDWRTAFNVGLNELDLRVQPGRVEYQVRYWRWAAYALVLSGALGAIGLALLLVFDVRSYVASNPLRMIPGLSVGGNLSIAWSMVLFWGFLWPWLLIALHKRPLRGLVDRLVQEVDAEGTT